MSYFRTVHGHLHLSHAYITCSSLGTGSCVKYTTVMVFAVCRLLGPQASPSWADLQNVWLQRLGPTFPTSAAGVACQQVSLKVDAALRVRGRSRAGRSRVGSTSLATAHDAQQTTDMQSPATAAATARKDSAEAVRVARMADASMAELLVRFKSVS